ncbi:hypothetical protein ACLOJK_024676 [Asimina triloba]
MALRDMQIGLAIALLTSMWAAAMAQSTSGCTASLISMSPCLSYITGNGSTPSSSCCSQLASVVQSQPQCLCQVLNGGSSSLGITINQTQALTLPGACNVQTPPASRCNAAGGAAPPSQTPAAPTTPVAPPSDNKPSTPSAPTSPAATSPAPAAPAVPTVPSGSGSKNTGSDSSDAKSITVSLSLISSLLFISAYAF